MPSSRGKNGTRAGNCKACHWDRVKKYRQTEKGRKSHTDSKRKYRQSRRAEVIEAYGGVCTCCGEDEPMFLTIDHINNDGGGRDRIKTGGSGVAFYARLKRAGYPKDLYRLLCFNCNTGRHINGGACPHEESGVYVRMAQRVRVSGGWPGEPAGWQDDNPDAAGVRFEEGR